MNRDEIKLIKQTINEVVKEFGLTPEKIILFGSRARGDFDEYSDWDILVIISGTLSQVDKKGLWYKIYKALHGKFKEYSFDIIIKTTKEFESEKEVVNTISNDAQMEGIRL